MSAQRSIRTRPSRRNSRRTKRAVTAQSSFALIDTEYFSLQKIVPTGNLKGIDSKRIKNAGRITILFTTGAVAGEKVGDQGTAPKKVIYLESEKSKAFASCPTQFMSLIPKVYNADTLGIRPDLIKRPIDSWAELLNPEFRGKAAILNIPSIGIMDAATVVEAKGIWSPAVTAVRTKGIACNFQPCVGPVLRSLEIYVAGKGSKCNGSVASGSEHCNGVAKLDVRGCGSCSICSSVMDNRRAAQRSHFEGVPRSGSGDHFE